MIYLLGSVLVGVVLVFAWLVWQDRCTARMHASTMAAASKTVAQAERIALGISREIVPLRRDLAELRAKIGDIERTITIYPVHVAKG